MAVVTIGATLAVRVVPSSELVRRGLALRSVGPVPTADREVAPRRYVSSARSTGSLTPTEAGVLVDTGMAPYATRSYVDTRDALNATKAQIDAGDALKLKRAARNVVNGIAGLDSGGRVEVARVPGTATQRYPRGFYTPAAYNSTTVSATTGTSAESTLFTHTVADPGYAYKLLISGNFDVRTATTGDSPLIRVRVGSAASSAPLLATGTGAAIQYRYGTDTFNRVAPALGPGWEQTYVGGGSGHAETNGTRAFWEPDGTDFNRQGFFRKVGDFATTVDDYQEVSYGVGDGAEGGGLFGAPGHNRIYGRVNSSSTSYVAFDITDTKASLVYANGGAESNLVDELAFDQTGGISIVAQFGYHAVGNRRRFRLLRNGSVKIDYTDTGNVTAMGGDFRGWGFGMRAGVISGLFGPERQAKPANIEAIALYDPLSWWAADPEVYSTAVLVPTPLSQQDSRTGNTVLYVTLRGASNSTVFATASRPRLHVMAVPA